ncbi:MAG: biosynthetic arginine decarboxylase [Opitutales bacterium]|nr:biosynthetic arginine decarboxylase [Opitutales bacterium]
MARKEWTVQDAEEYYGFRRWGDDHFKVDRTGAVTVDPLGDGRSIRVTDVIKEAKAKGLQAPLTIRFQDLLRHRVEQINESFRRAMEEENYQGSYRGVFPVKVNQLREVVEEILDAGEPYGFGIEAGSKPELMIALALHDQSDRLLLCNGYKDEDYIRLALLGRKLGKSVIIIVEQVSEIDPIIRLSRELGVTPLIGIRAKLLTRGEGKWALSTGENSKFGLTTAQILSLGKKLQKEGLAESLRLLHFHIGSQVPNILTIKNAVIEAARYYCQLQKMGFPMGYLDVGGGLGIDYDGSRSNFESSMNYTMEEYARDVVFNIREICESSGVPVPDIVSESGRAIVAPHSMLVIEVFDRITKTGDNVRPPRAKVKEHRILAELEYIHKNHHKMGSLEGFHDALQKKNEAFSLFNLGYLDLESRAYAENLFWKICRAIDEKSTSGGYQPEELLELKQMLADQYVCNFSVFQSLLDHWAFQQLFPVTPLHRLKEEPTVNAILVDITCDSDGKIANFIDLEDVKQYLALHPLNNQPYYLGVFLTGAYQDIMGDLHNLFGRVNEVHVFLEEDEEDGYYLEETISGSEVSDILDFIQYKESDLRRSIKRQIDKATRRDLVKPREGIRLFDYYQGLLKSKTYLDIPKPRPPRARKKT